MARCQRVGESSILSYRTFCGCGSVVEWDIPNVSVRVRFPPAALMKQTRKQLCRTRFLEVRGRDPEPWEDRYFDEFGCWPPVIIDYPQDRRALQRAFAPYTDRLEHKKNVEKVQRFLK